VAALALAAVAMPQVATTAITVEEEMRWLDGVD
jgi:hypothetical protein